MAPHVLVVEDEAPIRQMLVSTLASEGYTTEQATNGHEALASVLAHPPDVVLLDLRLPGMDGWQFLAHLRSTPGGSEVPVLVLSGSPRQRWDAEQVTGVMEYLPKPFHLRDMLDEVQFLYEFARSRPCCSDKYAA